MVYEVPRVPTANPARIISPRISVITAPTAEPVTAADCKTHMRISSSDQDTWITTAIVAARVYLERIKGRAFVSQTLEHYLDDWPDGETIALPRPPLQSITTLKYYDEDGVEATMSSALYQVDIYSSPGRLALVPDEDWPEVDLRSLNGIVIRYVAGYGAAAAVPATDKMAIMQMVAHLYEVRESVTEGNLVVVPEGFERLVQFDRVVTFA